jgi:hypothetical protein
MKLSILVPFRDADGTRTKAKEWIVRRWAHYWPKAEIIEASDDGVDPFNKSMAVNNAAAKATGDVYAILDADTWVDAGWMEKALEILATGRHRWVVPSRHMRLKQGVSELIMRDDPAGPFRQVVHNRDTETWANYLVGFLWIMTAEAWWDMAWCNEQGERRGMDERIRGWGGEDTTFRMAAGALVGPPKRLGGTVVCLWHARPRDAYRHRIWPGQDRTKEQDKEALAREYRRLWRRPQQLRELLGQR